MNEIESQSLEDTLQSPEFTESTAPISDPTPMPAEDPNLKNMKRLREKAERAERERDELLRRVQEMESQHSNTHDEQEDEVPLGPDDLAEGKHLKSYGRKLKKLEEELRNYKQQTTELSVETRLKVQYPDFDAVVSKESIDQLRTQYPEIAATLNSSSDLYSKAVTAYTLIKKLAIGTDDPYKQDKALAQKNAAKPRSLSSISPQQGDSPLSHANAFANGLTDDLRRQLLKEMTDAMKNR